MYTPKLFEENDPRILHDFMREFSFALIVTAKNGTPFGSHLPLSVEATGAKGTLFGHLARANNHWRQFDGRTEAMAVFQGPHSYISPNWYVNDGLVPTWNYATVHVFGRPQVTDDQGETINILRRLVEANETDATDNWSMRRLSSTEVKKQLKGIVAFSMQIDRLEGKFKMGQNRAPEDALAAARGVRATRNTHAEMVADEMESRVQKG